MTTLTPRLTRLDERVLDALPEGGRAMRAGEVAALVFGQRRWHCERCGRDASGDVVSHGRRHARGEAIGCLDCISRAGWPIVHDRTMQPTLIASPEDTETTREILHGLHRVGLLQHGRGGWWRRA